MPRASTSIAAAANPGLAPPIQMSDALAANASVEKNVISAYCLAHARRKVFELKTGQGFGAKLVARSINSAMLWCNATRS